MEPLALPSIEFLRTLFAYDSESEIITWNNPKLSSRPLGLVAGRLERDGYRRIKVRGKLLQAHRVAWCLHYGVEPSSRLDHKDLNRDNNAISNLREATLQQNRVNSNASKNNKCGLKGVCFHKNRWQATIKVDGATHFLGNFDSPEEAHEAYRQRASKLHGEFERA